MRLFKKILVPVVIIFVILAISSWLTGYVIALPISRYSNQVISHKDGDSINPLSKFDFNNGRWQAYLILDWFDKKNTAITQKGTAFKTTDIKVLNSLKENWNFKYTGGDMTTVENGVYFFKDGELVFKSGIVIDKNIMGLQSPEFGWLRPINGRSAIMPLRQFDRVYFPVIIL